MLQVSKQNAVQLFFLFISSFETCFVQFIQNITIFITIKICKNINSKKKKVFNSITNEKKNITLVRNKLYSWKEVNNRNYDPVHHKSILKG
jgi:hypothetical protein